MNTGLVDLNLKEIKVGDKLVFPYLDPMGKLYTADGPKPEQNDIYEVSFDHGAFVAIKIKSALEISKGTYKHYDVNKLENSVDYNVKVLRDWVQADFGEYISNFGKPMIFINNVVNAWIVE